MVRNFVLVVAVAIELGGNLGNCPAAFGQLIAYDGFEDLYYSDIINNPNAPSLDREELQLIGPDDDFGNPIVTPGWTGVTSAEHSTTRKWYRNYPVRSYLFTLDSLHHSAVNYEDASTGKVEFEAYDFPGSFSFRSFTRAMDAYDPADTYYMSFLLQTSSLTPGALGERGQSLVGFTNNHGNHGTEIEPAYKNQPGAAEVFGLMVGFDGRGTDQRISDLVLRAKIDTGGGPTDPEFANTVLLAGEVANPNDPADAHVSTLENLTLLVMLKLEVNVQDDIDLVTYWINPSDVSTEAQATSTSLATGMVETYAMDLNTNITRIILASNQYEDRTLFFDEPRLGYDFYSVAGVEPPPEGIVGDFNNDGTVNAADYVLWRDNLGGTAVLENDDTPGMVDPSDYEDWVASFGGMEMPSSGAASLAIPEPLAWSQILLLALGILARTRLARK